MFPDRQLSSPALQQAAGAQAIWHAPSASGKQKSSPAQISAISSGALGRVGGPEPAGAMVGALCGGNVATRLAQAE
eukprot:CAMPEP_0117059694 /NCGR_PEP_ID=MMETSP0472-20121206/41489_1 /TAXON_ID=693140 ORGANISM="Tiarina fusus, Strain LIS" /NCGR_SAMPLE_ID=MMETSP0472 /ASSEMBLY_ACC=CAM_ASM_000603 /LENGTH=75 /DNA_ID=CAMNT_0004777549 /DNA_START=124 /DNA_END=351 /DNA_ORIENTATION=+